MYIPQTYFAALLLMLGSMTCWGSWANAFKWTRGWRFELFYWDYAVGVLLASLLHAFTLGSLGATGSPFLSDLGAADVTHLAFGFVGGVVFNLANILLVAAIAIAGLAVAFPIGIGLALVIGTLLNYYVTARGDALLLFGGVFLVCAAIVLDALAYRALAESKAGSTAAVTTRGITISLLSGVGMGLFYPLVARGISGAHALGPYSIAVVFSLGVFLSTFIFNTYMMRRPVVGSPVGFADYFRGSSGSHLLGVAGGMVWVTGAVFNFSASAGALVGPAVSYAIGQGATMVSAMWGVFFWREFAGAGPKAVRFLALMFLFFLLGLTLLCLAPIVKIL
ncbi:MAG: hypothetical protein HY236_13760 [Acidobacteria bacterium]|nr:hypothetical protein [Acidobacteriota bacterium]